MNLSLKEKILVSGMAVVILLAVGSSVWVLAAPKLPSSTNSAVAESSKVAKQADVEPRTDSSSMAENNATSTSNDTKQNTTTPTPSKADSTTSPKVYSSTPADSTPAPTNYTPPQAEVPTCSQAMKVSYTSLRDSQVAAENTRWANQVNGFGNQASANGMSFSGYVEAMKQQYQPVHEANLASIEVAYQQNLVRVSCS